MSRQVPPSVTPPSPNEWPVTIKAITGITRDRNARVTSANHGFTQADVGITSLNFAQVKGMRQINGLPGRITSIVDTNNYTVDINSTQFTPYSSAGVTSTMTGSPPSETVGFQIMNTPFKNTFEVE